MEAIYDAIGDGYDTTRRSDPTILAGLNSLLNVQRDKTYLDIACGTGNYSAAMSELGGIWYAFDHSEKMLFEARSKSVSVQWMQCDFQQISMEASHVDGAICTLAIHHFPDLAKAFAEVGRVLKPRANFVIFTATPEQMRWYWLCEYFPAMMEKSLQQMPGLAAIEKALHRGGFALESMQAFFIYPELQDFFLYSGKQRPEMYLSEKIRRGISSFRNFCTDAELKAGLAQLQRDIESGTISRVVDKYTNDSGDYLFVHAVKS